MSEKVISSKIRVYCAVPTTGTIADSQTYFWRMAEKKYADQIEFVWPELCVRRIFHDAARNAHVEDFLATDCDILFFLDSDVVPPPDLFDIVIEHEKWKLAGAPYPIFMTPSGCTEPQIMFTAYNGRKGNGLGAADVHDVSNRARDILVLFVNLDWLPHTTRLGVLLILKPLLAIKHKLVAFPAFS